ncbi:hypothetical protein AKJ66_00450 [candidate division MSBL1 archaeon SCGC-AAA259E22]|uniref:Uncharacterized protein n=1 Tax=candidate division MSBL1 archaeon SCGC-AAA259E22 TaxID=1698265 RepID=A0A133UI43_9EURY|nr:hypothetical protein AKJ66_00450 [candidate division MSBL1 archaeon SCGC-AAA259E22]
MSGGTQPKYNGYRVTEIQVKEALGEGPGSFGEVLDKVKCSRPACNNALKDLIKKGDVEKYYDKKRDKLLYRLTEIGRDPVNLTILRLSKIEERTTLDLEKCRELLTNNVVEWAEKYGTLEWSYERNKLETPKEEFKEDYGDFDELSFPEIELNEYILLKALTRFAYEREAYIELEYCPVYNAAKEKGIVKQVENLLENLRPILPSVLFGEAEAEFDFLGLPGYIYKGSNLAEVVSLNEFRNWSKVLSFLREEKGGEKA